MIARGDLSDRRRARLARLLPPEHSGKRGRPWHAHRRILNGILWILRTGAPWRDLPARYGPWPTVYDRFVHWRRTGLWTHLLQVLQAQEEADGNLDWAEGSVDSTSVRAHQHAAGARHQPAAPPPRPGGPPAAPPAAPTAGAEALGRSRGGLTTKIHLVCDRRGRPLGLHLSAGQKSDSKEWEGALDAVRVPRRGRGRPRKRVRRLLGDKGYSYRRVRQRLHQRGLGALIPERRDQRAARRRKGRRGGRPCYYNGEQYRRRSWVERCINRLKQWRRVATRYEKRAANYLGMVTVAAILIWLS